MSVTYSDMVMRCYKCNHFIDDCVCRVVDLNCPHCNPKSCSAPEIKINPECFSRSSIGVASYEDGCREVTPIEPINFFDLNTAIDRSDHAMDIGKLRQKLNEVIAVLNEQR